MKSIVTIPDKVYNLYKSQPDQLSVRNMESHGISNHEARVMAWLMQKGKIINDLTSLPNPDQGTITTLIIADTHFPYHDERNVDIAINYGLKKGVDELIIAGDGVDFHKISKWFKKELVETPFDIEIERAKVELRKVSDAFKDVKKVYINGNHENRLLAYLCKNAPELKNLKIGGRAIASVKDILDLDFMDFEYVDNLELIQSGLKAFHIGKLYILHGHEPPKVGYNTINPAKLFYERINTSALLFHIHKTSEWIVQKPLDKSQEACWTGGALCSMHPDYAVINKWVPGFVMVERDSSGFFELHNKRIIENRVV